MGKNVGGFDLGVDDLDIPPDDYGLDSAELAKMAGCAKSTAEALALEMPRAAEFFRKIAVALMAEQRGGSKDPERN